MATSEQNSAESVSGGSHSEKPEILTMSPQDLIDKGIIHIPKLPSLSKREKAD